MSDLAALVRAAHAGGCAPVRSVQQAAKLRERADGTTASSDNVPVAYELRGEVDEAALRAALSHVMARHDALRTFFPGAGANVMPPEEGAWPLQVDDVRHDPAPRRAATLLAEATFLEPFDPATPPLLRGRLVRMHRDEALLVLAVDHLGFDEVSAEILTRELAGVYEGIVTGRPPGLGPVPFSFHAFAHAQRHWIQGAGGRAAARHWLPHLDRDTFYTRAPRRLDAGNAASGSVRLDVPLDDRLVAEIKAACRLRRVTPFILLATAVLLAQRAVEGDGPVGLLTPEHGRGPARAADVIGWFANSRMPLRLSATQTGNALDHVRQTILGASEHGIPERAIVDAFVESVPDTRAALRAVEGRLTVPRVHFALGLQTTVTYELPKLQLTRVHLDWVRPEMSMPEVDVAVDVAEPGLRLIGECSERFHDRSAVSAFLEAIVDAAGSLAAGRQGSVAR